MNDLFSLGFKNKYATLTVCIELKEVQSYERISEVVKHGITFRGA